MNLHFTVDKQKLNLENKEEHVVDKSHNYLGLNFRLSNEWLSQKRIFVILKNNRKENYLFQLKSEEPVIRVPEEITLGNGFYIGLYSTSDDARITTNSVYIRLKKSLYTTEYSSLKGDTDAFDTLFELLDNKLNKDDIEFELNSDSGNPVANYVIFEALQNKAEKNHTHDSNEITGIDTVAEIEIKKGYNTLKNKIRTYGSVN